MAFTGKATYSAGTTLPELAEDVSDLIGCLASTRLALLALAVGECERVAGNLDFF